MIIVEGTAKLIEGELEKALDALQTVMEASRKEDGCIQYTIAKDLFEPNLLRLFERWKDRDALLAHFAMPHMVPFREAMSKLKPAEIELRMYEATEQEFPG